MQLAYSRPLLDTGCGAAAAGQQVMSACAQAWTIRATGACGTVSSRTVADGVYAISNSALTACAGLLSGAACPSTATSLVTADDNSGNQRWTLTYVAGTAGVRLAAGCHEQMQLRCCHLLLLPGVLLVCAGHVHSPHHIDQKHVR